jgi:hypothetical protein
MFYNVILEGLHMYMSCSHDILRSQQGMSFGTLAAVGKKKSCQLKFS